MNNNHGPAPGNFLEFDEDDWLEAVQQNMLAPLLLIRAVLPRNARAEVRPHRQHHLGDGEIAAPRMELSTRPRTGLTAACKALSIKAVAADNVTINNLLPERIDTDRQRFMAERMMKQPRNRPRGSPAHGSRIIAGKAFRHVRRNSATPALSCAVRSRDSSPGKICRSTEAATMDSFEESRRPRRA